MFSAARGIERACHPPMLEDLRYALRLFARTPGFSVIAVLILAFGVGANVAVFAVINAILLRPLPGVADPTRLVELFRVQKNDVFDNLSYPDYLDFRDRSQSFSGLAAYSPVAVSTSGERIRGNLVTTNYFDVLGVTPAAGRLLRNGDEDAVVLSYGYWERRFARTPQITGQRVTIDGQPFVIAGVAARGFRGTAVDDAIDLWAPLAAAAKLNPALSAGILRDRAAGWIWIFGRLKPGVDSSQAATDLRTIAGQLAAAYPLTNGTRSIDISSGLGMYPDDRAEIAGLLRLLSTAVTLLLTVACANVAGLLMVRAARRSREIALRVALGASRVRILRQLLTEALLLAAFAEAAGLIVARWAVDLTLWLAQPTSLLRRIDTSIDLRVLLFTVAAGTLAGFLFALAPAVQSARLDPAVTLKSGSGGAGHHRSRLRLALVAGQVAISFLLLTASTILLRELYRILTADPGFETKNAAMLSLDLNSVGFSASRGLAYQREILDRVAQIPGVTSVTLAGTVPPQDFSGRVSIFYPGQEPPPEVLHGREFEHGLRVDLDVVAPHYFATLGIPLIAGRDFTDRDRGVIISRRLAERLWPGENAIGKLISWPPWDGPPRPPFEVIGVAADARYRSLTAEAPLLMYVPAFSNYDGRLRIVIRTAGDTNHVLADAVRAIAPLDKDVVAYNPQTMTQHIAESLWQQRMAASWIAAFGLLAMVLAAVGLYGVIAQSVLQRTREVGIRMALGAAPEAVERLVLREGMSLALAGLAVGIGVALIANPAPREHPSTLLLAAFVLLSLMFFACWIPARRAARTDPIDALRCE